MEQLETEEVQARALTQTNEPDSGAQQQCNRHHAAAAVPTGGQSTQVIPGPRRGPRVHWPSTRVGGNAHTADGMVDSRWPSQPWTALARRRR